MFAVSLFNGFKKINVVLTLVLVIIILVANGAGFNI